MSGHGETSPWLRGAVFLAAAMALSSCGSQDIGEGYAVRFGDRGKAWIESPKGDLVSGDMVLSVWSDDEVIVYQVYGDRPESCDYHLIRKADGAPSAISVETAAEMVRLRSVKLQTSSSSSCPLGLTRR